MEIGARGRCANLTCQRDCSIPLQARKTFKAIPFGGWIKPGLDSNWHRAYLCNCWFWEGPLCIQHHFLKCSVPIMGSRQLWNPIGLCLESLQGLVCGQQKVYHYTWLQQGWPQNHIVSKAFILKRQFCDLLFHHTTSYYYGFWYAMVGLVPFLSLLYLRIATQATNLSSRSGQGLGRCCCELVVGKCSRWCVWWLCSSFLTYVEPH